MEVQCPQCEKLYEVDDDRISGTTTLQCHACQHLFQCGANAGPSREDDRRWMVRDPETGDVRYLNTFNTLHEWIVEREIDQTWEISRTGDNWQTLGHVGEFRPIFQAADNVSSLEADRAVRGPDDSLDDNVRARLETLDQFEGGDNQGASSSPSPDRPSPASASGAESSGGDPSASASPSNTRGDGGADSGEGRGELPPSPKASADGGTRTRGDTAGRGHPSGGGAQKSSSTPDRRDASDDEDVRLETDMFGSDASTSDASDDEESWSMGDGAPLDDEASADEAWDDEIDYADEFGGPSRGKIAISILLLALVGGGAYLYLFHRSMVNEWLNGGSGGERASASKAKQKKADEPPETAPATISSRALHEARMSARKKADARALSATRTKARTALQAALADGRERAKEEAESREAEAEASAQPASTDTLLGRADQAQSSGQSSQARELYERVLERDPKNVEALVGLGWSFVDLGRHRKAVSKFQSAIDISPGYGDAYIGLGLAHRKLGQSRKALEAYKKYLERRPNGPSASIAKYQRKKLRKSLGIE